ncbi:SDR family NAD(P)-dependent oxidoreductase [Nocardia sp. alder85J]|uniref:SDR family NAD(P)-dependent oxidoreductase n=1 Tax=Nocardia sp. alder85J TaxID=2862949 RepID=UPI001CD33E40|nr:SDR family oxidoreductase [Nocardia sp. alder85J]MCX4090735.1 SDR family NAD(P)-dependent oxidoreductase [Nocardia sp. alder85J]
MGWFEQRAGLDGTVAVITGGAGGLGQAIVTDLAANGVRTAVLDTDGEAIEQLRARLAADGHEALLRQGDVRDPDTLAALFTAVDDRWGRLDTLVNLAGGTFRAPFTDTSPNSWNALLRMNLLHVLQACSLAVPRMRAGGRGGSIVNITTIEAHRAAPGYAVYSAAKAAVEQFSRTLAVEVAPDNIRINNIAPDFVPTPNLEKMAGGNGHSGDRSLYEPDGVRVAIPMARAGAVTDISNCVVFLASRLSTYLTGTTLHPDGGTYASAGWFNWPGDGWANHAPLNLIRGGH